MSVLKCLNLASLSKVDQPLLQQQRSIHSPGARINQENSPETRNPPRSCGFSIHFYFRCRNSNHQNQLHQEHRGNYLCKEGILVGNLCRCYQHLYQEESGLSKRMCKNTETFCKNLWAVMQSREYIGHPNQRLLWHYRQPVYWVSTQLEVWLHIAWISNRQQTEQAWWELWKMLWENAWNKQEMVQVTTFFKGRITIAKAFLFWNIK